MIKTAEKILQLTRAKDWRLSFVPFIVGCVYLWLWWFKISLSISSLLLFALSFTTTFGFAALGYFINDFFDKDIDAKAEKANVLAALPFFYQTILFFVCTAITFLPWLWLPKSKITLVLIATEILLFLLYSLPFLRFKNIPLLSGFIDSGYAYVLPLVLSFYTYTLFAHSKHTGMIYWLAVAVFFIGFRNITIHHVNDIFKDMRSHTKTLPQIIGVNTTNRLLIFLVAFETILFLLWSITVAWQRPAFGLWIVVYIVSLAVRANYFSGKIQLNYFSIEPMRHLADPIYQYIFPAFTLLLAITIDLKWLMLFPFHFALLITKPMQIIAWETIYWNSISLKYAALRTFTQLIAAPISLVVNYFIFFSFLLVGVNLRKEKMSAMSFLKKKMSRQ